MPFGIPSGDFHSGFGLYVVDAKTGENRGPVVIDTWDDTPVEEIGCDEYNIKESKENGT